jgi:isocitrate/isopropylmalate dehydrogenase
LGVAVSHARIPGVHSGSKPPKTGTVQRLSQRPTVATPNLTVRSLTFALRHPGDDEEGTHDRLQTHLRRLRKELHFFANLRPAFMYEDLIGTSPLKPEIAKGLDFLLVRELNCDIYLGQPRGTRNTPDGEFAGAREGFDTML